MSSSIPPRSVVCENPQCYYQGTLRSIHPIRIGTDVFTYPPAYCGCGYLGGVEMRTVRSPSEEDAVVPISDEELVAEARARGYRVLGKSAEPVIRAPFSMPGGGQITVELPAKPRDFPDGTVLSATSSASGVPLTSVSVAYRNHPDWSGRPEDDGTAGVPAVVG